MIDMKQKEEKYCGECCWFYAEDTEGYGLCPLALMETKRCDEPCTNGEFVRKDDMRHYMAVLLQQRRWQEWFEGKRDGEIFLPSREDEINARDFAYKYMKTFSKL